MNNIYMPTGQPEDWKRFLAKPDLHWKSEYSAKELAYCWENSNGFPTSIERVIKKSGINDLQKQEILFAIPEYKVPLPGGSRSSQNDLFVASRSESGILWVTMIEGKATESFGPTVGEWLIDASDGKEERLKFLCNELEIISELPENLRYQLFHRTVSAILTAKKLNTTHAMMLVHSFSEAKDGLRDYLNFLDFLGVEGEENQILKTNLQNIDLYIGWVTEGKFWAP